MRSRASFAYVVQIDGTLITLNLKEEHRGQVAGHSHGFSFIGQPDDLIGVDVGTELIVLRMVTAAYVEPKEAHRLGIGTEDVHGAPLRQITATVIGYLAREVHRWNFTSEDWHLPSLGSEAFPLGTEELDAIHSPNNSELDETIVLGHDPRNRNVEIKANVNELLSRHLAVLGASGQGKTHFVAAILQQLLKYQKTRIIVFDVNGEYAKAFRYLDSNYVKFSVLGSVVDSSSESVSPYKIPYYALGRQGLTRLLLPSEKTQLPALRFAIEKLHLVAADKNGAKLTTNQNNCLFDDCRKNDAQQALNALEAIRQGTAPKASKWPHMRALSSLVAEWSCVVKKDGGAERNAFYYSNVAPLVNRIRGLIEDESFREVVIVEEQEPKADHLNWKVESQSLVKDVFGGATFEEKDWKIHIIDLRRLTQDLMPFVLGALLELYASELFNRGPGKSHPTLLVLEEAHHYLRQSPGDGEVGHQILAYERLAKEGRKFGLAMLISTQRPSEVSPTVLAQCGTWSIFRLTNDQDQRAVSSASEYSAHKTMRQIPGLPRGHAIVSGAAMRIPARVEVIRPEYQPDSLDAKFLQDWRGA